MECDRISGASERIERPLTPNHRPTIGGRAAMADADSIPVLRLCRKCGRWLSLDYFKKRSRGLFGPCKGCRRTHDRLRRKPRTEVQKERHRLAVAAYRKTHRQKYVARIAVRQAILNNQLQRPDTCQSCGSQTSGIEAHHDDYSKPLDVRWLCIDCHALTKTIYPATDGSTTSDQEPKNRDYVYRCEWCGRFYKSSLPDGSACPNHIFQYNAKIQSRETPSPPDLGAEP